MTDAQISHPPPCHAMTDTTRHDSLTVSPLHRQCTKAAHPWACLLYTYFKASRVGQVDGVPAVDPMWLCLGETLYFQVDIAAPRSLPTTGG